ncbi:hypothetical protein KAI87_08485, partial [Myxococcota bacterium]|nr:hypothetical protein [Myxococcota bacterium]
MKRLILSTTLFVSFFFQGTAFAASPCATPRAAVDALIYWQQLDSYNLEKSAECIDQEMFSDKKERQVLARKLKGILDGRGLFVEVEDIPGQGDYLNQEGKARFVLFRHEPDIYVEKSDSRWIWSEHTLKATPELYSETFLFDVHAFNDHLPIWAHSMLFGLTLWQYFGLFTFLLIAVFIRALTKIFLTHWARKALSTIAAKWGDNLLLKSAKPVGTMAAGFFLAIVFPLLDLPIRMTQIGTIALRLLIALSAVFTIYRLVDVLTHWLTVKADQTASKLDDQLVPL